jgi:HPt (histidine-containing phosphotransfer) domain-containing protein
MTPLLDIALIEELTRVEVAPGESFLPHFLHTYTRDAATTLERMHARVRTGDTRGVAEECHRLKGATASIGAMRLAEALAEVEAGATASPLPILEARIQNALVLLSRSSQAILRYCHVAKLRAGCPPSADGCDGAT